MPNQMPNQMQSLSRTDENKVDCKPPTTDQSKPQLVRNQTHTKLFAAKSATEKKPTLSPISKKKPTLKPVLHNRRPIASVNERLYNAAQRRPPTYKTLAELVQEFDRKTRVYEDANEKKCSVNELKKHHLIVPRSPKLLSKNRNRARTALSQLEQDELIARTIKKNTFRAQPINKKIFENYATGIPKIQTCKKPAIKTMEFGFQTSKRLEMRKDKLQAIQQSIEQNSTIYVFRARPVPASVFKKVPIMMRNKHQLIKKQTSELCLASDRSDEKMASSVVKQNSDSTLTRIAKLSDQMNDFDEEKKENVAQNIEPNLQPNSMENSAENELIAKSLNENLTPSFTTFKMDEEESSFCEFKSFVNLESSEEYVGVDLKNEEEN